MRLRERQFVGFAMYKYIGKPVFDLVGALFLIFLLSPVILGVALLILYRSGRPIFFSQNRVGLHGELFRILKFRTMEHCPNLSEEEFHAGDQSRVTSLGRWLRASKVDELPQLINVLRGEMSLVGPRPEIESWVAKYPDRWSEVLAVRPGITDNASLLYRHEEHELSASPDPTAHYRDIVLPRKLDLYEAYVSRTSFAEDVRILVRTLANLFTRYDESKIS